MSLIACAAPGASQRDLERRVGRRRDPIRDRSLSKITSLSLLINKALLEPCQPAALDTKGN